MPADGRALPLKTRGFGRPRRQLVDKTTPAAADLKGAHVSSWPFATCCCATRVWSLRALAEVEGGQDPAGLVAFDPFAKFDAASNPAAYWEETGMSGEQTGVSAFQLRFTGRTRVWPG
jgi:hypothetical protein